VEYRWQATKVIWFFLNFYLYLPKESAKKKLYQGVRETSLDLLFACLLVMEFHFDAMLCSYLGNEHSDVGDIKCSCGPQVPLH